MSVPESHGICEECRDKVLMQHKMHKAYQLRRDNEQRAIEGIASTAPVTSERWFTKRELCGAFLPALVFLTILASLAILIGVLGQ